VRALALHRDVIVVAGAVFATNTVVVRSPAAAGAPSGPLRVIEPGEQEAGEVFVIDSPVLPDELGALGSLLEQAHLEPPVGLLATHGDWDHLLGVQAFPGVPLGVAESTARRLASGGAKTAAQAVATFDAELLIERAPLEPGDVQSLPVPGRLDIGELELELHGADGHTGDGMAVFAAWAGVLVCGDYLSPLELPTLGEGGSVAAYLATLDRLADLVGRAQHVVPGHGPVLDPERAAAVLAEDRAYLRALAQRGADAPLPAGRDDAVRRREHGANVAKL
jgi:glyoxylase-like metal-dependent hydrolase (beta-lactamase superfamily II)